MNNKKYFLLSLFLIFSLQKCSHVTKNQFETEIYHMNNQLDSLDYLTQNLNNQVDSLLIKYNHVLELNNNFTKIMDENKSLQIELEIAKKEIEQVKIEVEKLLSKNELIEAKIDSTSYQSLKKLNKLIDDYLQTQ